MQPHRQASRESAHAAAAADRADPTEVNETKEKREAARQCKDGRRRRKPPPNPNPRRKSRATLLPRPCPRPYTCKKSVLNESASPRCPPPIFLVVHAIGDWLIRPLDAADSAVAGVPTLSRSRSSIDTLCISPPPLTKLKLPSRCECECACDLECGCCACLEGTGMRGPGAKLDGKTRSEAVARCGAAEGWCWWGLRWPEGWAAEGVAEWMWPEGVAE